MKKILILTANPKHTNQLRLDEEVREIQEGLQRSRSRDQFEIISRWAVRPNDLQRALLDHEPQIVHFSGHGIGKNGLVLENNDGQMKAVSEESLVRLFKLLRDKVECVFLNACYSEKQAEAIHQYIDNVIGMSQAIGDHAAIKFATGFYDALGAGRSYTDAFEFGLVAIELEGIPETATPKLKQRRRPIQLLETSSSANSLDPDSPQVIDGEPRLDAQKLLQPTSPKQQSRIFISYSHPDSQIADKIASTLDSLGLPIWLDRREIKPGDSFIEQMNQGVDIADYVLVLFSQAALQSQWVSREWMSSLANPSITLIPIRLEAQAIPPLLQDIAYIDFVTDPLKGLELIKSFFQREFSLIPFSSTERRDGTPLLLQEASRRELRLVAQKCVSEAIVNAFLWDEEIDPGEIKGYSFNERLVNLLHFTEVEGILKEFAVWLNREKKRCVEHQLQLIRQSDRKN